MRDATYSTLVSQSWSDLIVVPFVRSYSDCTDTGHCFLTGRCRAKCRKRKHCQFYTTFRNGWCQLSTKCERRAPAGDARAVTFRKTNLRSPHDL